jgi:CBS domain-containing protein
MPVRVGPSWTAAWVNLLCRFTLRLQGADLPTTDEPFAAVILCTPDRQRVDKRGEGSDRAYSDMLRNTRQMLDPLPRSFSGGINKCVSRVTRCLGRRDLALMMGPNLGRTKRTSARRGSNRGSDASHRLRAKGDHGHHRVAEKPQLVSAYGGNGRVPVIGERGDLVGIVSEGDLMRRSETRTERRRAWWLEAFAGRTTLANDYVQANAQKVGDIMTRNVVTATPDTPLGEIAALLERHHIKRVPIVRDGKVLGIVSRANLIQALASIRKKISIATAPEDSAIREDLLKRLRNEPWVKLWSVNVIVHEGVVELSGIVDTAAEKKAIRVVAEATPGVREVIDHTI